MSAVYSSLGRGSCSAEWGARAMDGVSGTVREMVELISVIRFQRVDGSDKRI